MYMTRPPPVRSHQHSQLLQTEQFFQNGSLAWRYDSDDGDGDDGNGYDSDSAPAYMDVGHFRWFWPWGVRRSSTFDTMPAGKQRLPVAALLTPSSISKQSGSLLLTRLPAELRRKIWTLVLRTQCSARWAYSRRSPAWRPDRTGAPFIDAALLQTCRAVHAETWDLPMRLTQAVLADGTPQDKPGEWAPVVLTAGVLVPHAWQVLLLRRAEVTMQHFRLEAGFLDMWVAALGKLKAAAAACVADLLSKETRTVNADVVRVLRERQPLEEIVVRMNRMDWWTWTSVPPAPWPESLPGPCVADTDEEATEEEDNDAESPDEGMMEDATVLDETSHGQVPDANHDASLDTFSDEDDVDGGDEQGGYFSDHTASDASSPVYIFDAATLPQSLCLVPFKTDSWDRGGAYGVLSPHLRVTLMLETFGPKSLQLDAALAEVKEWRLPMPLVHGGEGRDVRAGAAVEDGEAGRVLAWDGRPVEEYHWLRDMSDEVEEAAFLRMGELRATAEGVVVKMMTLVPRSI
ncbi:hypothetical protein LMH87_003317 [Akanthomyces muscarius]|uniref:F-box domain-containing protein n=1 Tax=Akanthomyces muscarius TaxID=2231603 RepID=A0A9W8UGS0_AKAMU|nr:hypothetical protein LMH87_003317 [Akanthomyces muscarius]KAJ4144435.1 hypothetical protein LMH87_003317 [Akanthomyces muscarius]